VLFSKLAITFSGWPAREVSGKATPPTRTFFHYAIFFDFQFSAYTTTKQQLGGSSPLVITPSEDVSMYSLRKRIGWEFFGLNLCQRSFDERGFADCPRHAPKLISFTSFSVLSGWERERQTNQAKKLIQRCVKQISNWLFLHCPTFLLQGKRWQGWSMRGGQCKANQIELASTPSWATTKRALDQWEDWKPAATR